MIERPPSAPPEGHIAPYDAGWYAHEIGLSRETVETLAADPGWALLGYDTRAAAAANSHSGPQSEAEQKSVLDCGCEYRLGDGPVAGHPVWVLAATCPAHSGPQPNEEEGR